MKPQTYITPSGQTITTSDKHDIEIMKEAGWIRVKSPKTLSAKGLQGGKTYLP